MNRRILIFLCLRWVFLYSSRYRRRFRYWENDSHWLRTEWWQGLHRCTERGPTQRSAAQVTFSFDSSNVDFIGSSSF